MWIATRRLAREGGDALSKAVVCRLHCTDAARLPASLGSPAPSPVVCLQVVLHSFQPGGLVGRLCAPREMVLLRSWRQDTDGTYIVSAQVAAS